MWQYIDMGSLLKRALLRRATSKFPVLTSPPTTPSLWLRRPLLFALLLPMLQRMIGNLIWAYIATIYPPDYIITIMVEFLLKNGADPCPYHTLPQYTLWIT